MKAQILSSRKRGSWIWSGAHDKQNGTTANNKKRSVAMAPPNIPLPPTPQTQFSSPVGHQPSAAYSNNGHHHQHLQPLPVSLNGNSLYSSANDLYEHLPGEHHHMYDLTYEDTQSSRNKQRASQHQLPVDARSSTPTPPTSPAVTVNGITVNGFVLG